MLVAVFGALQQVARYGMYVPHNNTETSPDARKETPQYQNTG